MESFSSDRLKAPSSKVNPEDIQPQDCTLALLAEAIATGDGTHAEERVVEVDEGQNTATLDCKACMARLVLSGFANVGGATQCRALFGSEAADKITDSAS